MPPDRGAGAAGGYRMAAVRPADQVRRAQEEREQYAALVAEKQRENAALEADITEGPTDEKLEEIARDELGLVKPGEYVFEPSH